MKVIYRWLLRNVPRKALQRIAVMLASLSRSIDLQLDSGNYSLVLGAPVRLHAFVAPSGPIAAQRAVRSWPAPRASGSSVTRCNSRITKSSELRFHAMLGGGDREVRIERVVTYQDAVFSEVRPNGGEWGQSPLTKVTPPRHLSVATG